MEGEVGFGHVIVSSRIRALYIIIRHVAATACKSMGPYSWHMALTSCRHACKFNACFCSIRIISCSCWVPHCLGALVHQSFQALGPWARVHWRETCLDKTLVLTYSVSLSGRWLFELHLVNNVNDSCTSFSRKCKPIIEFKNSTSLRYSTYVLWWCVTWQGAGLDCC